MLQFIKIKNLKHTQKQTKQNKNEMKKNKYNLPIYRFKKRYL